MMKIHILLLLFLLGLVGIVGCSSPLPRENVSVKPSSDDVLLRLKAGNKRFYSDKAVYDHTDEARRRLAATESQGEHAIATVLACSDSRVPVELIFDVGIMNIFAVRVAGNVCNTDEVGSIEYGVCHVNTPVVVILGHTQCGAVSAVEQEVTGRGHPLEKNIPPLVAPIVPVVKNVIKHNPDKHGTELLNMCIEAQVWNSIERLFDMSPAVRKMALDGKVKVIGAIYDLASGRVNWLPEAKVAEILKKTEK